MYIVKYEVMKYLVFSRACSSRATYLLTTVSVWLVVCLLACLWTVISFQLLTPDGSQELVYRDYLVTYFLL